MLTQTQTKEVAHLFELGAHLGHKKSRLHPKAKKNVYQMLNGTSVIDLTATVTQLEKAYAYLKSAQAEGKTLLVVGTKKTASPYVKDLCMQKGVAFMATKWLPGLLTNFKTIMNNVKKLEEYRTLVADPSQKFIKHEKNKMQKDITKLEKLYGGLSPLSKLPDILLIIDIKKEKNALKEAQSFNIPVVGIADTNANPDDVAYPIVANDDTAEVVEYLLTKLLDAYLQG